MSYAPVTVSSMAVITAAVTWPSSNAFDGCDIATSTHSTDEAAREWCRTYVQENSAMGCSRAVILTGDSEFNAVVTETGELLWSEARVRGVH